jgi:hypothetical protein
LSSATAPTAPLQLNSSAIAGALANIALKAAALITIRFLLMT